MDNNQNEVVTTSETEKANDVNNSSLVINEDTIMASLAYLGPLVLIPFLAKKDNAFVKFHVKQGLVLLVPELILYVISSSMMVWSLLPLLNIINLGFLALSIFGIVYALQKQERQLPLIGHFADKFNI